GRLFSAAWPSEGDGRFPVTANGWFLGFFPLPQEGGPRGMALEYYDGPDNPDARKRTNDEAGHRRPSRGAADKRRTCADQCRRTEVRSQPSLQHHEGGQFRSALAHRVPARWPHA